MNNVNTDFLIKTLLEGGVVVFPTDTAYGIGCRMDFPDSVMKIFYIRKRVESKPLLVLVDSLEMAQKYGDFSPEVLRFAKKYWPGGVTIIVPCKANVVPSAVRAGGSTLAIRMPDHKEIREIISKLGVPIVAPSANISGEKTPYMIEDVSKEILTQADGILTGNCTYKKESTIIDATKNPMEIVRHGAVTINEYT